jgi:hypothetical protein
MESWCFVEFDADRIGKLEPWDEIGLVADGAVVYRGPMLSVSYSLNKVGIFIPTPEFMDGVLKTFSSDVKTGLELVGSLSYAVNSTDTIFYVKGLVGVRVNDILRLQNGEHVLVTKILNKVDEDEIIEVVRGYSSIVRAANRLDSVCIIGRK